MPSEEILHLQEFFIEGGNTENSHVILHITEPSTEEEKKKGYFFIICEINKSNREHISEVQKIINIIEKNYYETTETDNGQALEKVLDQINRHESAFLTSLASFHCVVGVLSQQELIFSFCGQPQIILFYHNNEQGYQTLDLTDGAQEADASSTSPLVFPQIIRGKIGLKDYFFVSTHHIINYFSHDRLQKLVTSREPLESCQQIERVLSGLKNDLSFGGLIVTLHKQELPESATPPSINSTPREGSIQSMQHLFATEKNTAHTLSSSLGYKLNEKIKSTIQHLHTSQEPTHSTPHSQSKNNLEPTIKINSAHTHTYTAQQNKNNASQPAYPKKDYIAKVIKLLALAATYGGRGILIGVISVWSFINMLFRNIVLGVIVLINYKNRRRDIITTWKRQFETMHHSLRHLPLITKLMILISALLIITFLGSIIYIKSNQKKTQQRTAYQQQIQEVKNKKDSAESALIYHDETTARTEAEEARQLVAKLPCASKEEKITCTELNNQLETIFTKLRKITVVTPELLTTWESLQQNKTQPGLTKLNTQLIGFAENKNLLTTYNLTSNETGGLETTSTNIGFSSAAVPKENDYIVLVSNKNELTLFTQLDNTFKKIDVTYPAENSTISSIVVYNRRLYSLDTTNNQIYRHDTIKNGFGKGKEWVTGAGIDLKDGTSLTIDGDLWVLKNSGEIIKLTKGQQQQFALIGLDPTLKNGGKIWTYNELKYLYILDPIGKRLIIVTKDGVLQHQVVAKEFQNPTDMVVDEETKTAYIIDGSKLFKINLPI